MVAVGLVVFMRRYDGRPKVTPQTRAFAHKVREDFLTLGDSALALPFLGLRILIFILFFSHLRNVAGSLGESRSRGVEFGPAI